MYSHAGSPDSSEVLGDARWCSDREPSRTEAADCTQLPSMGRDCQEASSGGCIPGVSVPMLEG